MKTGKRPIYKYHLLMILSNFLISLVIGMLFYGAEPVTEAKQGVVIEILIMLFGHLLLLVSSSTIYFLHVEKIYQNKWLSVLFFFLGMFLITIPLSISSIENALNDARYISSLMFFISSISLFVIWSMGYYKLRKRHKYLPSLSKGGEFDIC